MNLHYWKIAARTIRRHPAFSLINILGLSAGIAACLLIYLYVHNELNYDAYHRNAARIARVTSIVHSPENDLNMATSPILLAGALVRDYPEVEAAVRIESADIVIRQGSEVFKTENFHYSEPAIFSIFSFSFIEGSASGALSLPHSIVLTRSMAGKYFGDKPALGQTLICAGENYRVTAVIADLPANSDLPINALLAKDFSTIRSWADDDFSAYTFVLFHQKPDLRRFNNRISGLGDRYLQPELERQGATGYRFRFEAEALEDVHFSMGKTEDTPKGNRQFNRVFSILAAFILVIAMLNYINLATARATERMKEVGVRKVIGARPIQLVRQFLGESSFLVAIAWLVAIGLVAMAIPFFNRELSVQLSLNGWPVILFLVVLFPLTILMAGGYPAFVLSRFRPINALKAGAVRQGSGDASLRKILTVVQFIIALTMLAGTVIFYKQMQFITHKDLGIDRTRIICMNVPSDSVSRTSAPAFFQALRQETGIDGISVGSGVPAEGFAMSSTTAFSDGRKRELMCNYFFIDPQLLPLLHISLAAGRNFSDSFPADKKEGFIVNEAFVALMGWKSPLGQPLESGFDRKGRVVGVVKNFFFKSLHNAIEPMVMVCQTNPRQTVLVMTTPDEIPRLKQLWKNDMPSQPFDYYFMEENFDKQYAKDRITLSLFNAFTGLAILISCLGLYGLVSLVTLQRRKEIGIRKVLGASLFRLVVLLSKELVYLIGCAALIALPLAVIGGHRWLSSYAYRTNITVGMFVGPVAAILVLALGVAGYRILRAATRNPVESLRAD